MQAVGLADWSAIFDLDNRRPLMTDGDKNDDRRLHVQGNVEHSVIVPGDGNTVTYTTNVFNTFDIESFPPRPSQHLTKQEYRWRQVLVQNVKHYWIEGVLERSLHNQALIELGLEERSRAVASPISATEEFSGETKEAFPEGTQAADIFDNLGAGRTLLILGEPGSGKTTTLLKLTQILIARMGDDLSQPIPVVLNLSSWAKMRKPIDEWLVQSLYETFQVSKSLGTAWIKEEQLTLCLDGLDEVAVEHRNACLQALNHFLQDHGRTEVVVCSRIRDYEALSDRLKVKCAIYVQPLTDQQIDQYLEQAGEQLSSLRKILDRSPEIREFAASPLILSIMSLAYRGYSLNELSRVDNVQNFRQRLFDTYIDRMFLRRRKTENRTAQQTKYWLVWMAQRMIETSQTVFFIENMQPSWLQNRTQNLSYYLTRSLIYGLTVGLFFGLPVGLVYWLLAGLFSLPIRLFAGLLFGLLFGVASGLAFGLLIWLIPKRISGIDFDQITPVETLRWSWADAKKPIRFNLVRGLLNGMLYGIVAGFFFNLGPLWGLFCGLAAGLMGGMGNGPASGIRAGLRGPGISNKTKPNQAIWASAKNTVVLALRVGLFFGLFFGLLFCLVMWLRHGLVPGLAVGLLVGLAFGILGLVFAGFLGGGEACIGHFSLRVILYCVGYIPWNYARFLDYAAERLFLRKVGGGYIFIHRMLLEHFAQMPIEQNSAK